MYILYIIYLKKIKFTQTKGKKDNKHKKSKSRNLIHLTWPIAMGHTRHTVCCEGALRDRVRRIPLPSACVLWLCWPPMHAGRWWMAHSSHVSTAQKAGIRSVTPTDTDTIPLQYRKDMVTWSPNTHKHIFSLPHALKPGAWWAAWLRWCSPQAQPRQFSLGQPPS